MVTKAGETKAAKPAAAALVTDPALQNLQKIDHLVILIAALGTPHALATTKCG